MNMKIISDYDNQETIAQLLWNIRMTESDWALSVDVV